MDPKRFKLYDNFILMSNIEHHCLACNEGLADENKIAKHINKRKHSKKVQKIPLAPEYAEYKIYKLFSQIYYCKYCNKCVGGDSLKNHLTNVEHHKIAKQNPGIILGGPSKQFRSQIGEVIGQDLYNGIIDLTCYVCNEILSKGEEQRHIKDIGHRINLIQISKFEDEGVGSYRQIQDIFICHVCQEVYKMIDKNAHFLTEDHLKRLKYEMKRRPDLRECLSEQVELLLDPYPAGPPPPKPPLHPSTSMEDEKDEIADNAPHLVKDVTEAAEIFMLEDFYDYVKEHGKAKCKTCEQLLDINFKDMLDHKNGHENKIVDSDNSIRKEESPVETSPRLYLNENHGIHRHYVKYHETHKSPISNVFGGRYFFCRICYVYIFPKKNHIQEHILGVDHRVLLKSRNQETREEYKIVTIQPYVTNFYDVPELKMCLINGTICINKWSFLFVNVRDENKNIQLVQMACYICDQIFPANEEMDHYGTIGHYQAFLCARVVTTLENEFIREILNQIFHCGYCNKIVSCWAHLNKHLESWKHQKAKKKHLAMSNLVSSWYGFGTSVSSMPSPELYIYMIMSIEDIMKPYVKLKEKPPRVNRSISR